MGPEIEIPKINVKPKRVHLMVTGRVQGVGFRAYVQHTAHKLGLAGWVRNVGINRVETVAEGHPDVLMNFIEAVRSGPRSGRVDDLRLNWEDKLENFAKFEIRFD
jgi:acylphosphatase